MKTWFTSIVLLAICAQLHAGEVVKITVRDSENGWPVPLVELRTTHKVSFFTDNAGVVAIDLPELMGVSTVQAEKKSNSTADRSPGTHIGKNGSPFLSNSKAIPLAWMMSASWATSGTPKPIHPWGRGERR